MNHELQDIFSRAQQNSQGTIIQTITDFLRRSKEASTLVTTNKPFNIEETKNLIEFIDKNDYWVIVNLNLYISEGAEQKVYLKDDKNVLKLNDSIYYESWLDYFINLMLHNYFFPDTKYDLLGFYYNDNILYAVIQQPFIKANSKTDLEKVKMFMINNDFIITKNNDYFNPKL
jgi:Serine/Threonine/Tyrosine Kinase found in polyvalent proteins